jgi:endonuclease G
MKKLLLISLLAPMLAWANPIDDKCPQFTYQGAPVSTLADSKGQYLCKMNYAIRYNYTTKTPEYVVEHPTKAVFTGPAKRKDNFHADASIPSQYSAHLSDYDLTYDRGHMVPADDNTQSDAIMSESFTLANMVPQVPNNNRGIWKQLETQVRKWVIGGKDIYVSSGPIYDKGYKTIGAGVGVPTRLFKVVFNKTDNIAIAFLMPNTELVVKDLPKYATTVDAVEKATGLKFMPKATSTTIKTTIPNLAKWPGL